MAPTPSARVTRNTSSLRKSAAQRTTDPLADKQFTLTPTAATTPRPTTAITATPTATPTPQHASHMQPQQNAQQHKQTRRSKRLKPTSDDIPDSESELSEAPTDLDDYIPSDDESVASHESVATLNASRLGEEGEKKVAAAAGKGNKFMV